MKQRCGTSPQQLAWFLNSKKAWTAAFLDDIKTQSSVLHQLMVLGEAVKRLSDGFRTRHHEIPWSLMAGMRDKLIHGYGIVDLEEVWKTANRDMPDLLRWLEPHLPRAE
jgi:uncharacterized protein with HEPN domain